MSNSNTDDFDCNICEGDGYEYEQVEDKREKRPCPRPDCQKKLADSEKEKNEHRETTRFKSGFFDFMCDIIRDTDRLKMNHMIRTGYADEQDAIARRKLND